MQRSGGRSGRPFGHMSVADLESHVSISGTEKDELTAIVAELGFRKTKRAVTLKDLVGRLLRNLPT